MKASFSVSASVTAPGTYESSSANHSGQIIVSVEQGTQPEDLTEKDVKAILADLRDEFLAVVVKVEHGLLATIAEKRASVERAKEAAAADRL